MFLIGGGVKGGKIHGDWSGLAASSLYEGRDFAVSMAMLAGSFLIELVPKLVIIGWMILIITIRAIIISSSGGGSRSSVVSAKNNIINAEMVTNIRMGLAT